MAHATITRSGEVDFPLWVKAVAALIAFLAPFAIGGAIWMGSQIFDMSIRLAGIESNLTSSATAAQTAAAAQSAVTLLTARVERNERDIQILQDEGKARP